MHRFAVCLLPLLGLLVTTRMANADPPAEAPGVDPLYWALTSCEAGLEGTDRLRNMEEYEQGLKDALAANPNLPKMTQKIRNKFIPKDWIPKCNAGVTAARTKATRDRAKSAADQALGDCDDVTQHGPRDSSVTSFREHRANAVKIDPGVVSDVAPGGGTYGVELARCDASVAKAITDSAAAAKADSERAEKAQAEAKRKDAEEDRKAAEKRKAWKAQLVARLSPDRRKVYANAGLPDWLNGDYPADYDMNIEKIASAKTWDYPQKIGETGMVCTVRYTFNGARLLGRSKLGQGCSLVQ